MRSAADVADVVEMQAWAGHKSFTISGLKEELESLNGEQDDEPEHFAQVIFDELGSRKRQLRDAYPFAFDGYLLRPSVPEHGSSYLFCLGLSLANAANITQHIRKFEFETLVARAAQRYFGGDAIRIGAPWKTPGVPTYLTLLRNISDLIPELGPPKRKKAPQGGDGGWDVLVVKNFGDRQFPRLIALGNCATGRTDWRGKGNETEPAYFWTFFSRHHRSVCITFLAAPFVMDEDDRGRKSGTTTLTFDRMRICEHDPDASQPMRDWLEANREHLLALPLT